MKALVCLIAVLCTTLVWAKQRGSLVQQAPTYVSEQRNPYAGSHDAMRAGSKIYSRQCAGCHGRDASGMGKAPPLSSPLVRKAPEGALFWVLRNGSAFHGMPSFARLPDEQLWQIVTYLKSL